jgi:hypothetical protein
MLMAILIAVRCHAEPGAGVGCVGAAVFSSRSPPWEAVSFFQGDRRRAALLFHAAHDWQRIDLAILPAIHGDAERTFRSLKGDVRKEAIQEVIANTFVAFV